MNKRGESYLVCKILKAVEFSLQAQLEKLHFTDGCAFDSKYLG